MAALWLLQPARAIASPETPLATADVVSPVSLDVVNPEKTETLRQEAAARVPVVYRFNPEAVALSESVLRQTYSRTRALFWETMEQAARRPQLNPATVQHPSFFRFVSWFQEQNPEFPLPRDLARTWALREPDQAVLDRWIGHLRTAMNHCVISDQESTRAPVPPGSTLARVVSAPASQDKLTLKQVEKDGVTLPLSALIPLARAKTRLLSQCHPDSKEVGRFLAGFLRENCQADTRLTRTLRQNAVGHILALDHYEAGQVIVRRGDRIDSSIQAALNLLNTKSALHNPPHPDSPGAAATVDTGDPVSLGATLKQTWHRTFSAPLRLENTALASLFLLAVFSVLATFFLAWRVRKRRLRPRQPPMTTPRDVSYTVVLNPNRNETVFLPLQPPTSQVRSETHSQAAAPAKSVVDRSDRYWHQRALEAERRAEEILGLVRAGLAPQLARQMMHKLVRELISQRADWLQTQRIAEQDLAEIERRFTTAHGELVDRLRAFEKRTEELEKALAVKAEENSQLIKSHIVLTQNQIKNKETAQETYWN